MVVVVAVAASRPVDTDLELDHTTAVQLPLGMKGFLLVETVAVG